MHRELSDKPRLIQQEVQREFFIAERSAAERKALSIATPDRYRPFYDGHSEN